MIKLEKVHKFYDKLHVLKDIHLEIEENKFVTIVGPSGAGKTTLLHIIGSLDKPDSGKVLLENIDVYSLSEKKILEFRNRDLGFVFQFHSLLPEFTALENVMLPAFIAKKSKKEAREKALSLLDFFGLKNRSTHRPSELSGGEQQRVAVARAMINNPKLIIADEPSGNLDSKNAQELHNAFFELRQNFNKTIIMVTHNEALAKKSDINLHLIDGEISN
ncbi:MAG: ABC transporter ATP-binding protein [Bacteroidales bacterium]|jgi:lipoprotein-releasing system ATP-binding protein|nr:ABC transporter ATP-binding protein [Bacteroidales bacterium]